MIIKAAFPPEIFESLTIVAIVALEHFMWCNNLWLVNWSVELSLKIIWLAPKLSHLGLYSNMVSDWVRMGQAKYYRMKET